MSRLTRLYEDAAEENRRAVLQAMPARPGGTLLDVGCADGALTVRLADKVQAGRVLGVELAEQFLEPARANGVELHVADVNRELPFEDASIDVVHSNQVIEHLPGTDQFLRELRRVVRPDGYVLLSTNNLASWHNVVSLVLGWQPLPAHVSDEVTSPGNPAALEASGTYGTGVHNHLRIFTGKALAGLAAAHGLRIELDRGSGFYPLTGRAAQLAARVDRRHAAYLVQRYVAA